ncbi:MAG: hypothetical protein NUV91_09555, partial [Candidatus Omnitrophica bacterium]|nr:hypothetical protein [Candidatus Omnitrophota bacterium]
MPFLGSLEVSAQSVTADFSLPLPNQRVELTPSFSPVILRGMKVIPEDPFRFDFIVERGDSSLNSKEFKKESTRLIRYFLSALTIPEEDLWVNLSPYEKDRIIPDDLSKTEMGRDLLSQDYLLKQLTASLMYPESSVGKEFWERVYRKARESFGTTEIPVNTFHKVWIIPDRAKIYENGENVFIVGGHLKVMLEQDYLAEAAQNISKEDKLSTDIVRKIVLPAIEQEVNEGKHFERLRQIYHAMILATWFKRNLKKS